MTSIPAARAASRAAEVSAPEFSRPSPETSISCRFDKNPLSAPPVSVPKRGTAKFSAEPGAVEPAKRRLLVAAAIASAKASALVLSEICVQETTSAWELPPDQTIKFAAKFVFVKSRF